MSCLICLEEVWNPVELICDHVFCHDCLHAYVQFQINNDGEFVCPESGCDININPYDFVSKAMLFAKKRADERKHIKYHRSEKDDVRDYLHSLSSSMIAYQCSNDLCNGELHEVDGKLQCDVCSNIICQECYQTHDGECMSEVISSVALIRRVTRPCPACGVETEKNKGCDHMFCTICKSHYTWSTGELWKVGIHARQRPRFIMGYSLRTLMPPRRPYRRTE